MEQKKRITFNPIEKDLETLINKQYRELEELEKAVADKREYIEELEQLLQSIKA